MLFRKQFIVMFFVCTPIPLPSEEIPHFCMCYCQFSFRSKNRVIVLAS